MAQKKPTTDKKKIEDILSQWRGIIDNSDSKIKKNWLLYENYYLGSQWETGVVQPAYSEYNSNGDLILVRELEKSVSDDMPKRTINKIFPTVQTELAILSNLNPTVKTFPLNDKYIEIARRLNLFNREIFGDLFSAVYDKTTFHALQFGHGFFKISIMNVDDEQIPFKIIYVDPKDIKADPNADEWADVKCIVRKIKKYCYEIKEKYNVNLDEVNDFAIIELEEQTIKRKGIWNCYYLYQGKILELKNKDELDETEYIEKEYLVNLYEIVKFYSRNKGWWGISEIGNMIEYQKQINKRASQHDYHLNYLIDPAINVVGGLIDNDQLNKLPLKAGEYYLSKANGGITPIITSAVNEGQFYNSINSSMQNIEDITGVTKSAQGVNEQGVYSARHFKAIQDSTMQRFKLKEKNIKNSIKKLAEKVYILARDYLGETGKFKIYDYENDKYIYLTKDDFDMSKTRIDTEVVGANLLDPTSRLEKLIELKQYAPDIPSSELIWAFDELYHGIFRKDYVDSLKNQFLINKKQLDAQNKQIDLQQLQMDQQAQQITNPPMPQGMPQQMPQQAENIPQEQQSMPQEQVTNTPQPLPQELIAQSFDKIVQDAIQYLVDKGIKIDTAKEFILTSMQEITQNGENNLDVIVEELKNRMDSLIGG